MKKYVRCNISDAEIQNRIDSITTYDDFNEFESYLISLNLDNDTEYKWYNKAFVKFFGREPFDESGNFIKSSKRLSSSQYINASNTISPVEQEILDIYNKHATLTDVGYSGFDFEDGTGTLFDVEVGYRFPDNQNDEDGIITLGDVPFEYYFDDGNVVIDFQGNLSLLFDDEADYYDIYEKLLPGNKNYTPFKTVFYWGDIFEDVLEAIQMEYDEDYDDIEESTKIRSNREILSASSGLRKMTQKQIKDYVRDGAAIDITNYGFDEMKDFLHTHDLDKIAVSRGIYGINGGILQDRDTGEMYAITARNSALMMAF